LDLGGQALHIRVHSPAELRPFIEVFEAWMRDLGYPKRDLFAVRLALHEAATNAFRHGNRRDCRKNIHVRYLLTTTQVVLEVTDQGRGFDPEQIPNSISEAYLDRPGGRGLFLMRAYMTRVSFHPDGNRVTLCRQRSNS
jgi:serine/threonine-protein kinase RsbW